MFSALFGSPASPTSPTTPSESDKKGGPILVSATSVPPTPSISSSESTPTSATTTPSTSRSNSGSRTPQLSPTLPLPPPVKYPYKAEEALEDIPGLQYALQLFLKSKMVESEEYCHKSDEKKERLYFATGFSLIQCVKGLMSYEDEDLLAALNHAKHGTQIATQHRKKQALLGSIVSVITPNSSLSWIKSMTPVERHAELVYAESLFEKALLGIVYSGDWLAFIKEALNMRTTISTYRSLLHFLQTSDAEYAAKGLGAIDTSIDPHFRSGVYLGNGMANIVLSLMPGKLMAIVEMFGYHGEREKGLELLMRAGGWGGESFGEASNEGLRRPICDLCLLIFHLVISSFTFEGVNIPLASEILEYNLDKYPDSVFFLFGAGRLGLIRGQPQQAIEHYKRAMHVQSQYKSLHHVSWWEIAVAELALGRVGGGGSSSPKKAKKGDKQDQEEEEEEGSGTWWRKMHKEATWSRAIYGYGLGVCLYEESLQLSSSSGTAGQDEKAKPIEKEKEKKVKKLREEAAGLMKKVPDLRQRIAGKSIPLEKLVARKARKFTSQNNHLTLGALELSYIFQAIAHAPRSVILGKMIPQIRSTLSVLERYGYNAHDHDDEEDDKRSRRSGVGKDEKGKEREYEKDVLGGQKGFYDDLCLAKFLEGVCLRYVVYPEENTIPEETVDGLGLGEQLTKEEMENRAEEAFRDVFRYGPKIELDHYVVYHAHYELGRLLACQGKTEEAKHEFELVLSGNYLEVSASGRKGKYSLENALHVRTHAANEALKAGRRL